jgi:hypothetical protein
VADTCARCGHDEDSHHGSGKNCAVLRPRQCTCPGYAAPTDAAEVWVEVPDDAPPYSDAYTAPTIDRDALYDAIARRWAKESTTLDGFGISAAPYPPREGGRTDTLIKIAMDECSTALDAETRRADAAETARRAAVSWHMAALDDITVLVAERDEARRQVAAVRALCDEADTVAAYGHIRSFVWSKDVRRALDTP